MGLDIYIFCESRTADGTWISRDRWTEGGNQPFVALSDQLYSERNHTLFTILRALSGDEKCQHDVIEDLSLEVQRIVDTWGTQTHFYYQATLNELLAFDWTQKLECHGYVSGLKYYIWKHCNIDKYHDPESYTSSQYPEKVISEEEMQSKINSYYLQLHERTRCRPETFRNVEAKFGDLYCEAAWQLPLYFLCKDFLWEAIPKLLRLGKPEDVRIIFWFA